MPATITTVQTHPALGERGQIDIHLPEGPAPEGGLFPFVLAVHGGGWQRGDRTSLAWLPPRLAPRGWATVCCSYRVAEEAVFPAAFEDLQHLLGWLRAHGPEHGLDPDRAALLGGSAGGHLVSLLATRMDFTDPALLGVRAVVAYCPILDLPHQHAWDSQRETRMTEGFLGGGPGDRPAAYQAASPLVHVHAGMPPMFLSHGLDDAVVPAEPTQRFVAALQQAGVPVELRLRPGVGHSMIEEASVAGDTGGTTGPVVLAHEVEVLPWLAGWFDSGA